MHISLIAAMIHHDCAAASFSLFFQPFLRFLSFLYSPTAAHHNRDTVLNPEYSVLLTLTAGPDEATARTRCARE